MTRPAQFAARPGREPGAAPRRRHWVRWILIGVAALVILAVAAVAADVKLNPGPAPLALPGGAVSAPSGPLAGTWRVQPGSAAGFRIRETVLGLSNEVGGQTSNVTGTAVLGADRLTAAVFHIGLRAITVSGTKQPQLATSLATGTYPEATVTLARPVPLPAGFALGATVTFTAPAELALHGVTRPATATITARRDGTAVQAAGSIPVVFGTWGIRGPQGFGPFGSLADRGPAEFRLILGRG